MPPPVPVLVPAPVPPDGFWLVVASLQSACCGAMCALLGVIVLCMWLHWLTRVARRRQRMAGRQVDRL